jgi:glycosyltransferase involved in cell wall biosynthesis
MVARYLYRRAERIIVLARGAGDYLRERGVAEERLVYIPNGVDVTQFAGTRQEPEGSFVALYAGAHGPANGLDVVLRAAELLRGHSHIRFLLVGDGPAKASLVASARERGLDNVEFRDPVSKHEVPSLLGRASAGLMVLRDAPLFSFGVSPNKLFDYLGARLPVVCNVPGEVAEMLRAAGGGEQAADTSPEALADAVLRMAGRTPAQRAAMGDSGREWVAREHGRPVLAERLDGVLRALLPG